MKSLMYGIVNIANGKDTTKKIRKIIWKYAQCNPENKSSLETNESGVVWENRISRKPIKVKQ